MLSQTKTMRWRTEWIKWLIDMGNVTYEINTLLVKDMTVGEVINMGNEILAKHGARNAGIDMDLGLAALYIRNDLMKYTFTKKGFDVRVEDFYRMRQTVAEDFIQIHRLNYLAYMVVQDFADMLDEKGMLRNNLKKCWKEIEKYFGLYQKSHRNDVDHAAWMTVQDHLRLVCDEVRPFLEPLENTVRDYLIQKRSEITASGQKDDIPLLTKVYVIFMFLAALRNTRTNFLRSIYVEKGFDLTSDFIYADIDGVGRQFVYMMGFMGVKFTKDKDGDYVPVGVDMAQSVRVESAWNAIVKIVTNEELMDAKAVEAINMNPEAKAGYEARVAQCEKKELDAAIGELGTKFKVNRTS